MTSLLTTIAVDPETIDDKSSPPLPQTSHPELWTFSRDRRLSAVDLYTLQQISKAFYLENQVAQNNNRPLHPEVARN